MISVSIKSIKRRGELRQAAKLPDGKVWRTREHRGIGNAINYWGRTDEGHKWYGFLPVPPKPGDLIEHPTKNGVAQFKVLEVESERDPDDMFWCLTSHFGKVVQP